MPWYHDHILASFVRCVFQILFHHSPHSISFLATSLSLSSAPFSLSSLKKVGGSLRQESGLRSTKKTTTYVSPTRRLRRSRVLSGHTCSTPRNQSSCPASDQANASAISEEIEAARKESQEALNALKQKLAKEMVAEFVV